MHTLQSCTSGLPMHSIYIIIIHTIQIVEEDVDGYVSVVEGLEQEAKKLVRAYHFDSTNIKARQVNTLSKNTCLPSGSAKLLTLIV